MYHSYGMDMIDINILRCLHRSTIHTVIVLKINIVKCLFLLFTTK
jgi:hypothetical protein